ncbi:hypothetical protein IWQ62_003810 [Dispira parvispora]|uniref:Fungal-type protein kinase domain-containing protein n=1 Tax=Dispira parvispora TaxID=1520584 RepID=A0A9W8AQ81_9FUNG|nr:hypothetical protein IWQ62_003810 [Dispira parvispora]
MPNEVRIFNRIREKDLKLKKPLTGKGIPEMVYGGTVCVQAEYVYGDTDQAGQWCYDTVSRYCGEFKANTSAGSNQSPSTDQGESANSGNNENDNEFVERVHQRLLLTPVCESMATLHPHGTQSRSEIPIELSPREASDLCDDVKDIFQGLFLIIYGLYRAYGIYHRDLSEGNVLMVKIEVADPTNSKGKKIILNPLVIDFDHARFSDDVADSMSSRTGTLPFMSILNLAGRSDKLSFLDECESFLYLYLWKCTIGFTCRQVSPPAVRKSTQSTHGRTSHSTFEEKAVHQWATNASPNTIEDAKRSHMDSKENFTIVLKGLRPEFKRLRPLFHNLRKALFTWTGGSGALVTEVEKTTAKVITGSMNQGTSGAGPPKLASKMEAKGTVDALAAFHQWYNEGDMERTEIDSAEMFEVEEYDPLLKRYDYEEEVLKKFHALMKPKGNTQKQLSDIVEG